MTFSQSTAYNDKKILFINAFNPIILCALEFFKQKGNVESDNIFRYNILSDNIKSGDYCLAIYELKYTHTKFGMEQHTKMLFPVLYDISSQKIIENPDITKNVWGDAQDSAALWISTTLPPTDLIDDMKVEFSDAIDKFDTKIFNEQKDRIESVKILDLQRTEEYYRSQILRQREIICENEYKAESPIDSEEAQKARQILPAQRGRLNNMEEDLKNEIRRIEAMDLRRSAPIMKSLSYIHVK